MADSEYPLVATLATSVALALAYALTRYWYSWRHVYKRNALAVERIFQIKVQEILSTRPPAEAFQLAKDANPKPPNLQALEFRITESLCSARGLARSPFRRSEVEQEAVC